MKKSIERKVKARQIKSLSITHNLIKNPKNPISKFVIRCTVSFKNLTLNALEARFSIVLYAKILNVFRKRNTIQEILLYINLHVHFIYQYKTTNFIMDKKKIHKLV